MAHGGDDGRGAPDGLVLEPVDPLGLGLHDQGAHSLRVLGGDPDGACVGVAALGLDAPDRHHHGAGGVGVVRALDEPLDDLGAGGHLAARPDADPVAQPGPDEGVVDEVESLSEGHAHVVLEFEGRGPGAALGAVDDDEVGPDPRGEHGFAHGQELRFAADAQLEAGGLPAGAIAQFGDELQEPCRPGEGRVCGRGDALLALGNAARSGDLGGHLRGGHDAADAGLGALRELDRHALDVRVRGLGGELLGVELPVLGAASEVARADLPHEVAAGAQVVLAQAALAGVVGETTQARAFVERQDRIGGEGSETHGRDVQEGHLVWLRALRAAHGDPVLLLGRLQGSHGVGEELVSCLVDVQLGAEGLLLVDPFGPFVHEGAGVAVEGAPVEVALHEVLLHFRADRLQREAEAPQERVVPENGVTGLRQVPEPHRRGGEQRHGRDEPPPRDRNGQDQGREAESPRRRQREISGHRRPPISPRTGRRHGRQ